MTSSPSLWLGDLLAEQALGLELLTGGPDAATRPVLGAAVVEVQGATEWVAQHWVVLTAGVGLGEDPEAGRALVRECDAAEVSALGFGVEPVFDHVPEALIEEGEARGFPIFAVPKDTQFREIVSFVDTALGGGEAPLFRRLSSLQRYVVDALRDPEPESAVVERLARFLDASVAVLASVGRAGAGDRQSPDRRPCGRSSRIARRSSWKQRSTAGTWSPCRWPRRPRNPRGGSCSRAGAAGSAARWPGPPRRRRRRSWRRWSASERSFATRRTRSRAHCWTSRWTRSTRGSCRRSRPVAAAFGVDFSRPARIVVLRECALLDQRVDLSVLGHELEEALRRANAPHLLTERDRAVVALVQGGQELRALLDELLATQPGAVAGVGRPFTDLAAARYSHRDAELAARGAARNAAPRILAFEDFDLGTLLVSEAQPAWLGPKVEELIAPVRANPSLYEGLTSWFEHDLDIGAAAAADPPASELAPLPAREDRGASRPLAAGALDDRRPAHRAARRAHRRSGAGDARSTRGPR